MQTLRAQLVMFLVGACVLVTVPAQAQSDLTPLVTPPASIPGCVPVAPPTHARADLAHAIGHRLEIFGTHPGEERQITVFVTNGHPLVFNDYALVMTTARSSSVTSIAARFDSTGAVHGVRIDATSTLPDSVLTMRHDREALARVAKQHSTHTSSRAALNDVEKARVRAVATWLLKRCP